MKSSADFSAIQPSSRPAACHDPSQTEADMARSNREWTSYFTRNRQELLPIPWMADETLTPAQRRVISTSIAVFQLGEGSEGDHFFAAGERFAAFTGEEDYPMALKLFIEEEQRHSRELGKFMWKHGIPFIESQWTDVVFRFIRRLSGLEMEISVLLCAELIAKGYYLALRDATDCPSLQVLCRQILQDEHQHILFQGNALALVRCRRSRLHGMVASGLHACFMLGTNLVFCFEHHRVLRAGGVGVWRFSRLMWQEYRAFASCLRQRTRVHRHARKGEAANLAPGRKTCDVAQEA